jgi:hypothetical protein
MTRETRQATQRQEFTLPGGCMVCGGDVQVKLTPESGAWVACRHCFWISHPQIALGKDGLKVAYSSAAEA